MNKKTATKRTSKPAMKNTKSVSRGTLKSPRGKTYEVGNITAFAAKHKLDRSCVSRVISGQRDSHKKWVLA